MRFGDRARPYSPCRHAPKADRLVVVHFTRAMKDERVYRLYKQFTEDPETGPKCEPPWTVVSYPS